MINFAIVTVALIASNTVSTNAEFAKCSPANSSLREYSVDYGHSIVEFSIKFAFSRVKGRFTAGTGTILYDSASPASSSITMILQSKSLDTGWPHRDEHLRTSDFFDTDKFPTIEFRSRRLTQTSRGWTMEGDLTMHGVTKRVTIPFSVTQPPVWSPESRWTVMNLSGGVRIARADFGITGGSTFNSWFDKARAASMGDSIDVNIELEAYSPDARSQRSPTVEAWLKRAKTNGVESQITRFRDLKKTKTPAEFEAYIRGADFVIRAMIGDCRIPDAMKFSKAISELYPQSHAVSMVNGLVLAIAGDNRGAAAEYERAKQVFRAPVRDPNEKFPQLDPDWWYLDQLTHNSLEWGYTDEALAFARVLAETYSGFARAHTTYGQILALSHRFKDAAAEYDKALQLDPQETHALEWSRRLPPLYATEGRDR